MQRIVVGRQGGVGIAQFFERLALERERLPLPEQRHSRQPRQLAERPDRIAQEVFGLAGRRRQRDQRLPAPAQRRATRLQVLVLQRREVRRRGQHAVVDHERVAAFAQTVLHVRQLELRPQAKRSVAARRPREQCHRLVQPRRTRAQHRRHPREVQCRFGQRGIRRVLGEQFELRLRVRVILALIIHFAQLHARFGRKRGVGPVGEEFFGQRDGVVGVVRGTRGVGQPDGEVGGAVAVGGGGGGRATDWPRCRWRPAAGRARRVRAKPPRTRVADVRRPVRPGRGAPRRRAERRGFRAKTAAGTLRPADGQPCRREGSGQPGPVLPPAEIRL